MSTGRATRLLALVAVLGGAAAAIATVGSTGPEGSQDGGADRIELRRSSSMLRLGNSRRGQAVIRASNLAPGEVRRGRVEVGVSSPARVALSADRVGLDPGPGGGVLAGALSLRVRAIGGGSGRFRTIYDGPFAAFGPLALGRWRARDHYRVRVRVGFAAEPGPQDPLQGARTGFRLVWRASH